MSVFVDWRKLSISSTDSGAKTQWSKETSVKTKNTVVEGKLILKQSLACGFSDQIEIFYVNFMKYKIRL